MSSSVFGIDLGTTNSACARAEVGDHVTSDVPIDPVHQRRTILPSRVLLQRNHEGQIQCYVGRLAYERHVAQSGEDGLYVEAAKRHIGLHEAQVWPYEGLSLDPTDIAALVLRKVAVELDKLGVQRIRAVITHPRDFQSMQKAATAEAARVAGIELVETIDEPVAALYSWYRPDAPPNDGYYAVFDLGGGTLDIAIMDVRKGAHPVVIGGHGEPRLGGRDWDDLMFEQLRTCIEARYPGLSVDALGLQSQAKLGELAEELKRAEHEVTHQRRLTLRRREGPEVALDLQVNREAWHASAKALVARCRDAMRHALEQAKVHPDKIRKVIPAGGATRLKMVRDALRDMFGDRFLDPDWHPDIDLDHAIARGAARFGSYLVAEKQQTARRAALAPITTTLAHGLNVEIDGHQAAPLLLKGRVLPASETKQFHVAAPGGLAVRIHEGEPGPLDEESPCALEVAFEVQAAIGDLVSVKVDAQHSGRISFEATHHKTGERRMGDLRYDGEIGAAMGDTERRKAKLSLIQVL